jgi:GMP synthase (glutamine-hydrolysing)
MHLHYLKHVPFEGLGQIRDWAQDNGVRITSTRFYESDSLPNLDHFDWLIVMGGPMNIYEVDKYPWLTEEKRLIGQAIDSGKIVIGICLGAQLVADLLGARIYPNKYKEIGWFPVRKTDKSAASQLSAFMPGRLDVFHWHGDTFDLPAGAVHLVRSAACENQAFIYNERVIGLQFHLEATKQSMKALITHCAHELIEGPFIQSPETMLADEKRFHDCHATMKALLDALSKHVY